MDNIGLFILISWFIVGVVIMVGTWVSDMRGEEFNKNYFNADNICMSLIIFLFGYISLIIACYIYCNNNKPFTKFIYWIANIGVKKPEEE